MRSACALPLQTGGRLMGSLTVGWAGRRGSRPRSWTSCAFAAQTAQALDRLQTRVAERTALAALAGTVEALQRSLLSEPPEPDHLEVAVRTCLRRARRRWVATGTTASCWPTAAPRS